MTLIIAWSPTQKHGREIRISNLGRREDPFEKQLTQSLRTLYESYADWGDRKPHVLVMGMTGLRAAN